MNTAVRTKEFQAVADALAEMDPDRLRNELQTLADTWSNADAVANSLAETRKSVLAGLQLEYMSAPVSGSGKPLSAAAAELKALADPRYELHLTLMVDARKAANDARTRYDLGKLGVDLMRSKLATLRQEMSLSRM
jgi:hypothetical protein